MKGVDYSKTTTPRGYKCGKCGAGGVKLWRQYQTFSPKLLCCKCAAKDQNKSIRGIGRDGMYMSEYGRTDQIGWYVPAVPDEEGEGYWGYTSVPQEGVEWWKRLPTKPR